MKSPSATRFSLRSAVRLIESEGWENREYPDIRGLPTIGAGHKLTRAELHSGEIIIGADRIRWNEGLSDLQVLALLHQDVMRREWALRNLVKVSLTQNQFDALLMLVYNIGESAFHESTLLQLLNQGRHDLVPDQMRRWVYADGKVIKALVKRRESEAALWFGDSDE